MSSSIPLYFCLIIQFLLISYLCNASSRTEVKVICECRIYTTTFLCLYKLCEGQYKLSLQFAVMKSPDCFYIHLCDSIINIKKTHNLQYLVDPLKIPLETLLHLEVPIHVCNHYKLGD